MNANLRRNDCNCACQCPVILQSTTHDSSVQTELTPAIDFNSFEKLNQFRIDFNEPRLQFAALEKKYSYITSKTHMHHMNKLREIVKQEFDKFQSMARTNKDLIQIVSMMKDGPAEWLLTLQESGAIPKVGLQSSDYSV